MDNTQIWQAVLGEIELNLSKASFTTWFKNTFISSFNDDGTVIICTPTNFAKSWIEKKFNKNIYTALQNTTNQKIKAIFYEVQKQPKNEKKESSVSSILKTIKRKRNNIANTEINSQGNFGTNNKYGLNKKYTFSNFIAGKGNELAHAAAQAVTRNIGKAYNPLFIYGGVGLGKTHLLQAIGNEVIRDHKVLYTTSENFTNNYIYSVQNGKGKDFKNFYRNVDVLLIDDIQFMGGKDGTQEEFFHTFNELKQANKQIILTSDKPPKSIPAMEKRLTSRFECGMVANITQPDDETKIAILEEKLREKNYSLNKEILQFLSHNINNNIRELEGALNRIIAFHELNNSTPSMRSVKNILNDILTDLQTKTVTNTDIINTVSKFFDVSVKDIKSKGRQKELVWPRQIAIYLMKKELGTSYPTIGKELGGRDHTTAMHGYSKIEKSLAENQQTNNEIESIKQMLIL